MEEVRVDQSQELSPVPDEFPRPAPESSRQWIEQRYGTISLRRETVLFENGDYSAAFGVWVAAVPVMSCVAVGIGATEAYAINALRCDLNAPGKDFEPEREAETQNVG